MTTTIRSLTDSQISRLGAEAANAGDYMMAFTCELAQFGTRRYRRAARFLSREELERLNAMTRSSARSAAAAAIRNAEAQS